jgi:hypothetical protein
MRLSAALLLIALPFYGRTQDDPQARVLSLLAVYDNGRHGELEAMLNAQPKAPLAAALLKHGDRWIASGPEEARDRRRLVAGAVSLEIVAAGLRNEWKDIVELIEWACKHVMATKPGSAAEAAWHIASIALLQDGSGMMRTRDFAPNHIEKHTLKRLPDSPRARLAFAMDEERGVSRPVARPGRPEVTFEATARFNAGATRVVDLYTALMTAESVADEARLRLGAFYLRTGSIDEALSQLRPLTQSADAFTGYVSSFLVGEGLRSRRQYSEAAAAYRQALIHVPNAMSASLGLAASLAAGDDMTAALAGISGAAMASAPIDPWRIFAYGEGRHWALYRDTLRKELKR